jgi:Glycosyltransferase family 87
MMARAGRVAFATVFLALIVTALFLAAAGHVERQSFKAFYCAGVAIRQGHDPYRVEPLRTCERRLEVTRFPDGYVEPAPLPGYDLLPFAALSLLPAKAASLLFSLVLVVAAAISAKCLSASIRAPSAAILLALAPLTLLNVAYGEIAPLATLAICCAAYYAACERWREAGIATALALVQPNVGFAVVVAMLIFAPRARVAIVVTGGILGAVSLALLGIAGNTEFFLSVLPLMARAELVASDQFSSSRLLYALGASPQVALLIAQLCFAITLVFGVLLAGRYARAGQRDMLVVLPPAAVSLLGVFLHDLQILIAVPAALLVASRAPSPFYRALGAAAVALLVAVWTQPPHRADLAINFAGVAGGLYAVLGIEGSRRLALALSGATATVLCFVILHLVQPATTAADILTRPFTSAPDAIAPTAWAAYLLATPALTAPEFAPQIVAWLGLFALLGCALLIRPARFESP